MDCPYCEAQLRKIGTQYKKRYEIIPIQRKFQGGIVTTRYGYKRGKTVDSLKESIPDGVMFIDKCKSCGWTSVWRKDGIKYDYSFGVTGATWRNIESGLNINTKHHLKKYGFKQ